jgi:hypothetical protein
MNKGIAMALVAVGIGMVLLGMNASESLGSDVSRFFTGTPTRKSMILILGGMAAIICGGIAFKGARKD